MHHDLACRPHGIHLSGSCSAGESGDDEEKVLLNHPAMRRLPDIVCETFFDSDAKRSQTFYKDKDYITKWTLDSLTPLLSQDRLSHNHSKNHEKHPTGRRELRDAELIW